MLRSKGLSEKVLLLGIDGMDPKFSRKMVDEGYMPNLKKLIEKGAARHDLRLLGGVPTITPPMWTTLATGAGIKEGFEMDLFPREVDVAPTAAVLLGVDIPKDCEGAPAYQIFTERM